MAGKFSDGKEIVLGYGKYEKRAGFVNQLVQWDTFFVYREYSNSSLSMIQRRERTLHSLSFSKSKIDHTTI